MQKLPRAHKNMIPGVLTCISNYKYVCFLCEEYTKIIQSYKFVQPNKNMNVSFVVPKI